MNLKGKKVVVTGGGSGYGRGIAAEFAKAGAKVWITGRNREKLAAAVRETGAKAVVADVTRGASEDPSLAAKCMSPEQMGEFVLGLVRLPVELTVPEVTIQPMVQDIVPM